MFKKNKGHEIAEKIKKASDKIFRLVSHPNEDINPTALSFHLDALSRELMLFSDIVNDLKGDKK